MAASNRLFMKFRHPRARGARAERTGASTGRHFVAALGGSLTDRVACAQGGTVFPCCAKTRPKRDSRKAPPHYDVVGEPSASGFSSPERLYTPRLEPTRTCVKLPAMDPLPVVRQNLIEPIPRLLSPREPVMLNHGRQAPSTLFGSRSFSRAHCDPQKLDPTKTVAEFASSSSAGDGGRTAAASADGPTRLLEGSPFDTGSLRS